MTNFYGSAFSSRSESDIDAWEEAGSPATRLAFADCRSCISARACAELASFLSYSILIFSSLSCCLWSKLILAISSMLSEACSPAGKNEVVFSIEVMIGVGSSTGRRACFTSLLKMTLRGFTACSYVRGGGSSLPLRGNYDKLSCRDGLLDSADTAKE